jgi:hypothetical protein
MEDAMNAEAQSRDPGVVFPLLIEGAAAVKPQTRVKKAK